MNVSALLAIVSMMGTVLPAAEVIPERYSEVISIVVVPDSVADHRSEVVAYDEILCPICREKITPAAPGLLLHRAHGSRGRGLVDHSVHQACLVGLITHGRRLEVRPNCWYIACPSRCGWLRILKTDDERYASTLEDDEAILGIVDNSLRSLGHRVYDRDDFIRAIEAARAAVRVGEPGRRGELPDQQMIVHSAAVSASAINLCFSCCFGCCDVFCSGCEIFAECIHRYGACISVIFVMGGLIAVMSVIL